MSYIYKAIYKCRLCGEIFNTASTGSQTSYLIGVDLCSNQVSTIYGGTISRQTLHNCKDDSYGFADFQGFQKESIKDEIYRDLCNL